MLSLTSCSDTRYYIVRHAEKLDNTANSPLSGIGEVRAETLATTLSKKEIERIFVSDRQRTQQTAAPTARLFGLQPIIIPETETDQLIEQLKKVHGENVLVVRHSPEIHLIVNALSPNETIAPIADEFDNLFVVTRRVFLWQRWTFLKRLKYG